MTCALAVLAKAPLPGLVKTRLAADVGVERALAAYRSVGAKVVSQVRGVCPVTVWFAPAGSEPVVRDWLGQEVPLRLQPDGDLGVRLSVVCDYHFDEGADAVIVIGADAPGVDADVIRASVRALEGADVVVGPALDGGYYLIGLSRHEPALFAGIPWGTADVFHMTMQACARIDLSVALLEPLRDLDTGADLVALGLDPRP